MAKNLKERLLREQIWSNIAIQYDLLYKQLLRVK